MGLESFVKSTFVGGTVYQAFLNPWCYHRWNSPVAGKIIQSYKLGGTYYLQNPTKSVDIHKDNYVDSQPMLSAVSVRYVFIIEAANKNIGHVAVIEIGMAEVSSVNVSDKNKPRIGQDGKWIYPDIGKGEELGYFAFGGSSYVMIFSNNLKRKEEAKGGDWYFKWNPAIFEPVKSDGPDADSPPAPAKMLVFD